MCGPAVGTALAFFAILSPGCESTSTSVAGPSETRCGISATTDVSRVGAAGGSGTLRVEASRECVWTAASRAPWIVLTSDANGQGQGSVAFNVTANNSLQGRRGTLVVEQVEVEVAQDPVECRFEVSPRSISIPPAGEERSISVTATNAICPWTVAPNAAWIDVVGDESRQGNATVRIRVEQNVGAARTATLAVAGQSVSVAQEAAACSYALSDSSQEASAQGGGVSVNVLTTERCTWTAVSAVPWIDVADGSGRTGPGAVNMTVAPNTGAARTGRITIAGRTFTVEQAGACTYAIAPTSADVSAVGGLETVAVTAPSGCTWTAVSDESWIAVTLGANGTGNGSVTLTVAPNPGTERTGTVVIAGRTFTVTQAGVCVYDINPSSNSVPASGGEKDVTVIALVGCAWTAESHDAWIVVEDGASGNGSGTVTLEIAPNSGAARTGTVTIAGETYTITQAAGVADAEESERGDEERARDRGDEIGGEAS